MRSLIAVTLIFVGVGLASGCSTWIRWKAAYRGTTLKDTRISMNLDGVALKCEFALLNGWRAPIAVVEMKNNAGEHIYYDFSGATISSDTLMAGVIPSDDLKGSIRSGKKTRVEIPFERMIGVHGMKVIGGRERLHWTSSPITLKLGVIESDSRQYEIPDLEFADDDGRDYL